MSKLSIQQRLKICSDERDALAAKGVQSSALLCQKLLASAVRQCRANRSINGINVPIREAIIRLATPVLHDAIVAADLLGSRRSYLFACPYILTNTVPVQSANVAAMSATPTVYAGTIDWLQEKMELTDEDLEEINDLYDEPMLTATTDLADSVDKAVQAAIIDSTKAGESVTNAIKRLRQVFVDEGLTEQAPYRLEAVYRTSVQQGYAAGRWRAMNSDAIRPHIKGLTYHAVEDDRTTPLCEQLDGTTLPMDDPFWETYNPPNHWNCRSTVLEIFDDQEMEIVEPDEDIDDPQEGFGVNFGEVLTTETA